MPALSLFLIGAPGAGKSSVFEALTNTPAGPSFTTKGMHRIGTVKVPDDRLVWLRDLYKPKKFTPAETTFVDVALPAAQEGENKLSQLTTFLGEADAFALVVQAFGEYDGRGQPLDPPRQLESVLLELVVSDLDKIERRFERLEKERNRGTKTTPEQEVRLLEQARKLLENGQPLRGLTLSEEEARLLRGYCFLSQKPVLVVANVDEKRLDGGGLDILARSCEAQHVQWIQFCAPLEAEIAQLGAGEQAGFLQDYGLKEPASIRLIQAAYRMLNLISFFTVGEDEVRAWTLHQGTGAQQAAGKIHSDIERGFIRAETVAFDDLVRAGSWAACRDAATLRLEGKTYTVRDGDIINFRFNA